MAALHAAANAVGRPLYAYLLGEQTEAVMPLPEIQIFGGGAHAGRRVDIQDFMIVAPQARSFDQALEWTAEVYRAAGALMEERGLLQGVADEGGFWPAFDSNEAALDALMQAIERAGFTPGQEIAISLDIAASEFHQGGLYRLARDGRTLDTTAWPRCSCAGSTISDRVDRGPARRNDADGLRRFTAALGGRVQIVGDDFLVTNAERVKQAAALGICNAVLVKPNQAGTVTRPRRRSMSARGRMGRDRLGALRRDRGCDDRASRDRLGRRAIEGRLVRALGAHGKWNECLRIEGALVRGSLCRRAPLN